MTSTGGAPAGAGARRVERASGESSFGDAATPAWRVVHRADLLGLLAVLAVTSFAAVHSLAGGTLIGQDAATQHFPWYAYLGEHLRSLEIPGWNPFQFAGAPFAADPQSGWAYLPAMAVFGLLPMPLAVPVLLWVHLALAGTGTYLLARWLGMPAVAAVVAAVAYQLSGPVYGRSSCCLAGMEIAVWTPWALAGAELAIRRDDARSRIGGWTIAGFAVSQALAAWLGQGAYYVLLALAGYVAYRTLVAPPTNRGAVARGRACLLHGAAIGLIGFGLAAVSVLPRLDYVARSNLAGGEYAGEHAWAARISGVISGSVFDRLLTPTLYYPGTAILALGFAGVLLARGRFAMPYFAILGLVAAVLASPEPTPLHRVLYAVLPRFEELHRHWPERVSFVAYLAPPILAGAAVAVLLEHADGIRHRAGAIVAPVAIAAALWSIGAGIPKEAFLAAVAAVALALALVTMPQPALRRAIPTLLVAVIVADLLLAGRASATQAPYGGFHRVDIGDYYGSTGAAEFINAQTEDEPARSFGYDPRLQAYQDGQTVLYRNQFADPATQALNVNNRAMLLGLDDIQGYNPVQMQRYVEYMTALNGHPQDYHDANIFPGGLDSPLLDLLNVRYVVIPADPPPDRADFRWLIEHFTERYRDGDVRVLENPEALPRAWIVHDVRQVTPGEALPLLADGSVDPRVTALVEGIPPAVSASTDPSGGLVDILEHEPDLIRARAETDAAGMLVFSEVFDPGWRAFVDGVAVPVQLVNHVLRGIPLAAGVHEIELRYRTPALLLGLAITGGTVAVLFAVGVVLRFGPPRRVVRRAFPQFGTGCRRRPRLKTSG